MHYPFTSDIIFDGQVTHDLPSADTREYAAHVAHYVALTLLYLALQAITAGTAIGTGAGVTIGLG